VILVVILITFLEGYGWDRVLVMVKEAARCIVLRDTDFIGMESYIPCYSGCFIWDLFTSDSFGG